MEREELVALLRAGDEAAWRRFVEQYGGSIYAIATKLGLSGADRDDLFQGACLSVVRSIETLRDPARLSSWIFSIAYREGIDLLRRRRREQVVETIEEAVEEREMLCEEPRVLRELERLEEIARLQDAMARLDRRCRRLLAALFLEDPPPSYADLARRERMPLGSIGPIRARCLGRLRDLLAGLSNRPPSPSN